MLYRIGDIKWTSGAYLRNCKRKKYVLARLPNGRITFARSYDDRLTPSPISKITNSYEWGKRTVYRPEDLLTGKTAAGKKLLENRDWEIAAVNPGEINPAFRPNQKPLDPLPEDEVRECVRTLVGIADGTLSRHILMEKSTRLGPKNIGRIDVISERYLFTSGHYEGDWLNQNISHLYDHTPPPTIKRMLSDIHITFSISRRAALRHQAEVAALLSHLPTILFKLQNMADIREGNAAVRLNSVIVRAETEMPISRFHRIKIINIGCADEARFRRMLTPVISLEELVNPLRG